jgi:hypothetical protein
VSGLFENPNQTVQLVSADMRLRTFVSRLWTLDLDFHAGLFSVVKEKRDLHEVQTIPKSGIENTESQLCGIERYLLRNLDLEVDESFSIAISIVRLTSLRLLSQHTIPHRLPYPAARTFGNRVAILVLA